MRQKGGNDERDKEAEGRNFILPLSLFQKKTLLLTLMFFLLVKNRSVALGPMLKATPLKKRTLPIASSPRSKKKATPRKVKSTPKAVRPTPISVFLVSFFFVAVRLRARGTRKRKRARRERGNGREREAREFWKAGVERKKGRATAAAARHRRGEEGKHLSFRSALRLSSSILSDFHERGSRSGNRPVPCAGKSTRESRRQGEEESRPKTQ